MTHISKWLRENLALPAGMVLIAAAAAGVYQAREASPEVYKMLADQYPKVGAEMKAEIALAMQDNKVTRWESTKLMREILRESRAIVLDMQTGSIEQERAKLQHEVRNPSTASSPSNSAIATGPDSTAIAVGSGSAAIAEGTHSTTISISDRTETASTMTQKARATGENSTAVNASGDVYLSGY